MSPGIGRLHATVLEGDQVAAGDLLGLVNEGSRRAPLVAPVGGVIAGWMAWEGERVYRGTPLARIQEA